MSHTCWLLWLLPAVVGLLQPFAGDGIRHLQQHQMGGLHFTEDSHKVLLRDSSSIRRVRIQAQSQSGMRASQAACVGRAGIVSGQEEIPQM
jgi:hypothetical protein